MNKKTTLFSLKGWMALLALFLMCLTPVFSQTVTVYWDEVRQEVDGFGASAAFRQADNLKAFPTAAREEILDLLFSKTDGIGLSIVRNMVGDGSMSEWGNSIDGPVETIEPQNGVWDLDAEDEQIWFMHEAAARGCDIFMSTVWSPPRWMKSNNSCINGGSVLSSMYDKYAEYLARYVNDYMLDRNGIDIYAISVANEPNLSTGYSSCQWSSEQFRVFVRDHLGPRFDSDNVDSLIMIGENSDWTESPATSTLNDSRAAAYLDIVASHNYGGSSYSPFNTAQSKNKKVWQTEVSNLNDNDSSINDGIKWAREIHNFFNNANGNAWLYWWTICYKVNPAKGEGLINIDTNNKTWYTNKRLFTMGQYSRFVRPGWNRISLSSSSTNNMAISAFKDTATNEFAVVVINEGYNSQNFSFSIDGASPDSVIPYVTSSSMELSEGSPIQASGGSFSYNLPARSVVTFSGGSGSPIMLGDANGSGNISIVDALMVAQASVGLNPEGFVEANADVNGDGRITVIDALMIAQYCVGIIDEF